MWICIYIFILINPVFHVAIVINHVLENPHYHEFGILHSFFFLISRGHLHFPHLFSLWALKWDGPPTIPMSWWATLKVEQGAQSDAMQLCFSYLMRFLCFYMKFCFLLFFNFVSLVESHPDSCNKLRFEADSLSLPRTCLFHQTIKAMHGRQKQHWASLEFLIENQARDHHCAGFYVSHQIYFWLLF